MSGATLSSKVPDLAKLDLALLPHAQRAAALERFLIEPSRREKPGRYWKIDLENFDLADIAPDRDARVTFERVPPGVIACDLHTAMLEYPQALERVRNQILANGKFASLTQALLNAGAFIYLPAGCSADEPLVLRYKTGSATISNSSERTALFPHIVVLAEKNARLNILERFDTSSFDLVCANVEILACENAHISYTTVQSLPQSAQFLAMRAGRCERHATLEWSSADLGAGLSVESIDTVIAQEGSRVETTAIFFPNGSQHVDLATGVEHLAGHASSETIVKSAAAGRGQGRYLGTIRIAKDAQGSDARLRNDALLLSKNAHIDSVPALEISANDVKAFHGATVGAIDEEQRFYIQSRGIRRDEAENMITLAFFEPAIDRFPTESLREELRAALTAKIG